MLSFRTTQAAAKTKLWRLGFCVLFFALTAVITGCRSTGKPGGAALAAIDIPGNTPGQIRPVATEVFQVHGYHLTGTEPNQLIFDKPGSRWNNLASGSWVDEPPVLRVKLRLTIAGQTECRLECRAFLVRDPGGATEEELPLRHVKPQPYRQLLEEIASRFRSP